jgi:hypothetical protein
MCSVSLECYNPYLQPQKVSKNSKIYCIHISLAKITKSHIWESQAFRGSVFLVETFFIDSYLSPITKNSIANDFEIGTVRCILGLMRACANFFSKQFASSTILQGTPDS